LGKGNKGGKKPGIHNKYLQEKEIKEEKEEEKAQKWYQILVLDFK